MSTKGFLPKKKSSRKLSTEASSSTSASATPRAISETVPSTSSNGPTNLKRKRSASKGADSVAEKQGPAEGIKKIKGESNSPTPTPTPTVPSVPSTTPTPAPPSTSSVPATTTHKRSLSDSPISKQHKADRHPSNETSTEVVSNDGGEGQLNAKGAPGGRAARGRASGGRSSGGRSSGGRSSGGRSSGGRASGGRASEGRASGGRASEGRASGGRASGGRASGGRASGARASGGGAAGGAAGGKASEGEANQPNKKLTKEQYKEQKFQKPHAEKMLQIKYLWKDIGKKPDAQESIAEMIKLMEDGKLIVEFAMKRDLSRVIQTLLKYGSDSQKDIIFANLKDQVIPLIKNSYSTHLVYKMLVYGTKEQRQLIIQQFYGQVRMLVKHRDASKVVELAYCTYSNSEIRKKLLEEFYGPEFSLFKSDKPQTLREILEQNPLKKTAILSFMRNYLFDLTNKPEVLANTIVHKPLLQYLKFGSEVDRAEMIQFMGPHLPRFLHSKDGAHAAALCIVYGPPKERKVILKASQGYIKAMCKEEFGHITIAAIFRNVDDTKLVKKYVLKELLQSLKELVNDEYGVLPLLALLHGVDTKYFPAVIVDILTPKMIGEGSDQQMTSKKDDSVRQQELLEAALPDLVEFLKDPEQMYEVITNERGSPVVYEVMQKVPIETKVVLMNALLSWVNFTEEGPDRKYHPMEKQPSPKEDLALHSVGWITLKQILANGPKEIVTLFWEKVSSTVEKYFFKSPALFLAVMRAEGMRNKVAPVVQPLVILPSGTTPPSDEKKNIKAIRALVEEYQKEQHATISQ